MAISVFDATLGILQEAGRVLLSSGSWAEALSTVFASPDTTMTISFEDQLAEMGIEVDPNAVWYVNCDDLVPWIESNEMSIESTVPTISVATDVSTDGVDALVSTNGANDVQIINIENAENPIPQDTVSFVEHVADVAIFDGRHFVAHGNTLSELTTGTNVTVSQSIPVNPLGRDINALYVGNVTGDELFVAANSDGTAVVGSVANNSLNVWQQIDLTGFTVGPLQDVAVSLTAVYFAAQGAGVLEVRFDNVTQVRQFLTPDNVFSVAVDNSGPHPIIYAGTDDINIRRFNGTTGNEIDTYNWADTTRGLVVDDERGLVFAANRFQDIIALDTTMFPMELVKRIYTDNVSVDLSYANGMLAVADGITGMALIHTQKLIIMLTPSAAELGEHVDLSCALMSQGDSLAEFTVPVVVTELPTRTVTSIPELSLVPGERFSFPIDVRTFFSGPRDYMLVPKLRVGVDGKLADWVSQKLTPILENTQFIGGVTEVKKHGNKLVARVGTSKAMMFDTSFNHRSPNFIQEIAPAEGVRAIELTGETLLLGSSVGVVGINITDWTTLFNQTVPTAVRYLEASDDGEVFVSRAWDLDKYHLDSGNFSLDATLPSTSGLGQPISTKLMGDTVLVAPDGLDLRVVNSTTMALIPVDTSGVVGFASGVAYDDTVAKAIFTSAGDPSIQIFSIDNFEHVGSLDTSGYSGGQIWAGNGLLAVAAGDMIFYDTDTPDTPQIYGNFFKSSVQGIVQGEYETLYIGGSDLKTVSIGSSVVTISPGAPHGGNHPVELFVRDQSGEKVSISTNLRVEVPPQFDDLPDLVTIPTDTVTTFSLRRHLSDPNGDDFSVAITGPAFVALNAYSPGRNIFFSPGLDDVGSYTVGITARDGFGSTDGSIQVDVCQAPYVSAGATRVLLLDVQSVVATTFPSELFNPGVGSTSVLVAAENLPPNFSFDGYRLTGNTTVEEELTFEFSGTNTCGLNTKVTVQARVQPTPKFPSSVLPEVVVRAGETQQITMPLDWYTDHSSTDTHVITLQDSPGWFDFRTTQFIARAPMNSLGSTYNVSVTVTDAAGASDTATLPLRVSPVRPVYVDNIPIPTPSISGRENEFFLPGSLWHGFENYTIALEGLMPWMTLGSQNQSILLSPPMGYSGTPQVTVTVQDDTGLMNEVILPISIAQNTAPGFSFPFDFQNIVGTPFRFNLQGAGFDNEGDVLLYSVSTQNSGLQFDNTTGLVSGEFSAWDAHWITGNGRAYATTCLSDGDLQHCQDLVVSFSGTSVFEWALYGYGIYSLANKLGRLGCYTRDQVKQHRRRNTKSNAIPMTDIVTATDTDVVGRETRNPLFQGQDALSQLG